MPRVNLEDEAFSDQRIELLGQLCGYNRFEALGRMAHLWRICTQRSQYVVSPAIVAACLGAAGPEAIVTAELGEPVDDGIRVKGTDGRIEWVQQHSSTKQAAGQKRAQNAPRDARGRLLPRSAGPAHPADIQQAPPAQPAESSALLSGSDLSGSGSLPPELPDPRGDRSGDRAPRVVAVIPARTRADDRRKLFGESWLYAARKHRELRAEGIDPHARDCWGAMPSASSAEAQALFARIDELTEGDAPDWEAAAATIRNRIDVAAAEARAARPAHLRFFIPARIWHPDSFAIGAALSPEQAAQPRASPRAAPPPEPTRRIKTF